MWTKISNGSYWGVEDNPIGFALFGFINFPTLLFYYRNYLIKFLLQLKLSYSKNWILLGVTNTDSIWSNKIGPNSFGFTIVDL